MNLIHCAETIKGGVNTYLASLVKIQRDDPFFEKIVLLFPSGGEYGLDFPVDEKVVIHTYKSASSRILNSLRLAILLLSTAKNYSSPIVHFHSTFAGLFPRLFGFFLLPNARLVYCSHGWAFDIIQSVWVNRFYVICEFFLSWFSHAVICISKHDFNRAQQIHISNKKIFLVRNGVLDFDEYTRDALKNSVDRKPRALFVGRFDRQKGFDVFCEVANLIGDEWDFFAIGDFVVDSGLALQPKNILFLGWQDQRTVAKFMSFADVLIVPSRWEGFGLVAVEAMRSSTAVIASKVGGLAEIIVNGETGVLVDNNRAACFSIEMRNLSFKTLRKFGSNGRDLFEKLYNMKRVHLELKDVYMSLDV